MNSQSDYDAIKTGMRAYQGLTSVTADYPESPLIAGMHWMDPERIPLGPATVLPAANIAELGYCLGKLCGEVGEANEHFWKWLRDGKGPDDEDTTVLYPEDIRGKIIKELGDALWYIAQAARQLDVSLGDVAVGNLEKLRSRAERGVLKGSGDDR